jgi:hypothetical protein
MKCGEVERASNELLMFWRNYDLQLPEKTEENHENSLSVRLTMAETEFEFLQITNQIGVHTFFYLVCEAVGTAATPGLMCQPRVVVKIIVEKQMECRLAGETEVFRENLPQRHFCPSQNPT